jgi:putative endonuclease
MKSYYIYILASKRNGTLYIGVTNELIKRLYQHKTQITEGFTKKYQVYSLVYFEEHSTPLDAIAREKQLKNWKRQWKIELIENSNPTWKDLYQDLLDSGSSPE